MGGLIAGIMSGIITGLGMGGGVFLIALLTYTTSYLQNTLQSMNLLYYIATSLFAIIIYAKNKNIDYKNGLKIISFGIVPAIIGALVANEIDVILLKRIFAIYLTGIGMLIIFQTVKKNT